MKPFQVFFIFLLKSFGLRARFGQPGKYKGKIMKVEGNWAVNEISCAFCLQLHSVL